MPLVVLVARGGITRSYRPGTGTLALYVFVVHGGPKRAGTVLPPKIAPRFVPWLPDLKLNAQVPTVFAFPVLLVPGYKVNEAGAKGLLTFAESTNSTDQPVQARDMRMMSFWS